MADNSDPRVPMADWEEVHGRNEIQFPQLELVKLDLSDLPPLQMPRGYVMRSYKPGDEQAWGRIMSESFNPYWDAERFRKLLVPHFGFKPERVLFAIYDGEPVGSASAFKWPGISKERGYIHMVGVEKKHCGRGLGYQLALGCLYKLRESGFREAMLQTEDFRIPAIKHYLRLGFRPVIVIPEHREKWTRVLERIGRPDLIEEYDISGQPAMSPFAFWLRSMQVSNYLAWLNLRWSIKGRKSR